MQFQIYRWYWGLSTASKSLCLFGLHKIQLGEL